MRALSGISATSSAARGMPIFTDGFYRQGMLGCFIGLARLLTKIAGIDLTALLNGKPDAPEWRQALLFHSPLAHPITATPALLFSLGIPPQQRALLGASALHERLLRLINCLVKSAILNLSCTRFG